MSTANNVNSSKFEPQIAPAKTPAAAARHHSPAHRSTQDIHADTGPLLAQIPDLEPKAAAMVPAKRIDGRMIGQALSTKLVFGVGFGLVIGAILPFLFGKASRNEAPVKELPAWSNNIGSATIGNTSQDMAPAWQTSPPAPATTVYLPPAPPAVVLPQPPHIGDTRPTALNEPAWPERRVTPTPPTGNGLAPSFVNTSIPNRNAPDVRGDYRGLDRPNDPSHLQADYRNDAAALYHQNDAQSDYRGTVNQTGPARPDVPAREYQRDTRYDNGGGNYLPATPPGNPLMPSGNQTSTGYPPNSEPGVARFEGSITAPPLPTGYERPGPGN